MPIEWGLLQQQQRQYTPLFLLHRHNVWIYTYEYAFEQAHNKVMNKKRGKHTQPSEIFPAAIFMHSRATWEIITKSSRQHASRLLPPKKSSRKGRKMKEEPEISVNSLKTCADETRSNDFN